MQVKLLRAIQEKSIRPVGEQVEIKVDVRILSATHKDLEKLVSEGVFRQDLFYRINVIKLDVPSLRERTEDIPLLTKYFLGLIAKECEVPKAKIDPEALKALMEYNFPGNVRELENIIERAFTLCENDIIQSHDLNLSAQDTDLRKPIKSENSRLVQELLPQASNEPARLSNTPESPKNSYPIRREDESLDVFLESIEKQEIEKALIETKWNRTASAKLLGMSFRALRYRLKKLDMD